MNQIDRMALFRLSVLGPLVSRERLCRGELQQLVRELAQRSYDIPGSRRQHVGEKTIESWYYLWRRHGIDGLAPKRRIDRGQSRMGAEVQAAILAAKGENPRRSIRQVQRLLEAAGVLAGASVSRSAIHRLLQQHGISRPLQGPSVPEEHRRFVAEHAGALWYGDVMHGPTLILQGRSRKTYLVSLLDDASRLVAHSAFCLAEGALEIEGVLKQALLTRHSVEARGRQRGGLPCRHAAGHLRACWHRTNPLPPLRTRGGGEVGEVSSHLSRQLPR